MSTIYQMTGYALSQDYERLADAMQVESVICILDYERDLRDVAHTIWSPSKNEEGIYQISARGTGYIYAFNRADFIAKCQKYHVGAIFPTTKMEPIRPECLIMFQCHVTGTWHTRLRDAGIVSAVRCDTCQTIEYRQFTADSSVFAETDSQWNVKVSNWLTTHQRPTTPKA